MKKIFCALIFLWMVLTFAGCGGKEELSTTLSVEETTAQQQQSTASPATQTEENSSTTVKHLSGLTGSRLYNYLIHTNHTNIAGPKIINAIKLKDVGALEAMMCRNIKENVSDLPGQIRKLMDSIDGEILYSSWDAVGNYDAKHGDDGSILQVVLDIDLTTSTGTYYLVGVMWETANTFAEEEAGIRNIGLSVDGQSLVRISATEGVGKWHD